jgi:hypothetical protein
VLDLVHFTKASFSKQLNFLKKTIVSILLKILLKFVFPGDFLFPKDELVVFILTAELLLLDTYESEEVLGSLTLKSIVVDVGHGYLNWGSLFLD